MKCESIMHILHEMAMECVCVCLFVDIFLCRCVLPVCVMSFYVLQCALKSTYPRL